MAQDIKQRIVLEGEKEYSSAIKNAQRNLKTLRSELKADTAELGANATAQEKNRVKAKNLQKQIQEQKKVVDTYRAALEEVREKYGDNADAIAKYEQKLNDARTALANMKNQLDQTGNAYRNISAGAQQGILENNALAESFSRISEAAATMSGKIESVFNGVVGTISNAVGAVWGDLMDIAARANSWTDLASYMGSTTEEVQKWDRAISAAQGDFSKLTSMTTKLRYGGKSDKIAEWFEISDENYENDLEYTVAVLQKMVNMEEEMKKNGTWYTAMTEVFGRRMPEDVTWFIDNWQTIQDNLEYFDVENGGPGIDEEQVQTMNDLYLQVGKLQESWKAFKDMVETTMFGKLALNLTSNAQGALDALIAFMDADTQEERDRAIADFQANIEEAFTKIGEAIAAAGTALEEAGSTLQTSENGWVRLLGDVLEKLGKAMEWIADPDNLDAVKTFFETLIAIWAAAQMTKAVGNLLSLANSFKTIHNNRALTNALNNFGNTVNNGGTGAGTGTGTGAGAGGAQTVGNMTVSTETVSNATVANMTVQNMIGGTGTGANNPITTGDGNNGQVSTPYLLPSGSNAALPARSSSGSGQQPLLTSGSGSGGGEVIDLGDGTRLVTDTSGGSPNLSVPDITISADTMMFGADMGLGVSAALMEYDRITKADREKDEYLNELLEKYELDMDRPEVRAAVERAVNGYSVEDYRDENGDIDYDKLLKDGELADLARPSSTATLPGDIEDRFAAIAEEYGTDPNGHHSMSSNRTLSEIWDSISDVLDKTEELYKIANDNVEDDYDDDYDDWDYHSAPDYDSGYYGDDWSIEDIMRDIGGNAGWWKDNSTPDGDRQMRQIMAGLPNDITNGLRQIKVIMDSEQVGYLTAPVVSQYIARNVG